MKFGIFQFINAALTILSLGLVQNSHAQDIENFVSLKSCGVIPQDFTTLATQKYKKDYAENLDEQLGRDFFLSSRFYIDELLLSGQVLFNEEVSDYVNDVAGEVLKSDMELRNKLRFYVLKTNVANAFSTDQGIIIITTAMIARLQNEAQLAFILAHEVSHFVLKHVRDTYKVTATENKETDFNDGSDKDRLARLNEYSQQNEFEADSLGLEIFFKSEYSVDAAVSALVLLEKIDLPPTIWNLDTCALNSGILTIPGFYYNLQGFRSIGRHIQNASSKLGTHPELEQRIIRLQRIINDRKNELKPNFYRVAQDRFLNVRDLCRFESINISLYERYYNDALYTTLALKVEYPNNRFLDLCLVKSLYGIAKYKNCAQNYPTQVLPSSRTECESYLRLERLIQYMDKSQMSVIAYRTAYDMRNRYTNDQIFEIYESDMKKELALRSHLDPNKLKTTPYHYQMSSNEEATDTIVKPFEKSRFEKKADISLNSKPKNTGLGSEFEIKTERKTTLDSYFHGRDTTTVIIPPVEDNPNREFYLHAFADLIVPEFIMELLEIQKVTQDSLANIPPVETESKKQLRNYERYGRHFGLESIVIVDPRVNVLQVDEEINHVKSEKQKLGVQDAYDGKLENLEMNVTLVDSKNLSEMGVAEYNNLSTLNQWGYEMISHNEVRMIPSTYDQVTSVSGDYDSRYFMFSYIEIRKDKPELDVLHVLGLTFIPAIPITAIDLIVQQNYLYMATIVVNSETSIIEYSHLVDIEVLGKQYMINNYIYDLLYQLGPNPKSNLK